jgi:hypothetical protein
MNTRTRYLVITSLLVLTVGLGTGLVAYYGGFPTSAFSQQAGPDELKFVPSNASLVAYADVQQIMTSGLREKLRSVLPGKTDGRQEFQSHTGINIETDIDRVVAFVAPTATSASAVPGAAMVLARGRFDVVKIEALMREHGARAEDYTTASRRYRSDFSNQGWWRSAPIVSCTALSTCATAEPASSPTT